MSDLLPAAIGTIREDLSWAASSFLPQHYFADGKHHLPREQWKQLAAVYPRVESTDHMFAITATNIATNIDTTMKNPISPAAK